MERPTLWKPKGCWSASLITLSLDWKSVRYFSTSTSFSVTVIFYAQNNGPVYKINTEHMFCSLQMNWQCLVISQRMRSFSWAREITSLKSTDWWERRMGQCIYVSVTNLETPTVACNWSVSVLWRSHTDQINDAQKQRWDSKAQKLQ